MTSNAPAFQKQNTPIPLWTRVRLILRIFIVLRVQLVLCTVTEPHSEDSTREPSQPRGPGARACGQGTQSLAPRIYCSEALRHHLPLRASFPPRVSHGTSPVWTREPRVLLALLQRQAVWPAIRRVLLSAQLSPRCWAQPSHLTFYRPRGDKAAGGGWRCMCSCVCARVHARVAACVCGGDALPSCPLSPT